MTPDELLAWWAEVITIVAPIIGIGCIVGITIYLEHIAVELRRMNDREEKLLRQTLAGIK